MLNEQKEKWSNISRFIFSKLTSTQIIVCSFTLVIWIGAMLLRLPFATQEGEQTTFLNALFTSTSAVCVTGLTVLTTRTHWTFFGKTVILILIQIGGLGFMTLLTTVMIAVGKKITLRERLVLQESFNLQTSSGLVRILISVVKGTFLIEGICAIILAVRFMFDPSRSFWDAVGMGIFHSISAFCNAGFDVVGEASLAPYVSDPIVNIVIMSLVVVGGIGFAVWFDVIRVFFKEKKQNQSLKDIFWHLRLHTKIVLAVTFFLIMSGALFVFVVEWGNPNTLGSLHLPGKLFASFFQSISPRTAGFATINISLTEDATKFMLILLMFVGGSPGSAAGGIKTATLGIALISVISVVRGKSAVEAFRKTVPIEVLQKALTVIFMMLTIVIVSTMMLTVTEKNMDYQPDFLALLFTTTSAVSTSGLDVSVSANLSELGKIIVIVCMFLGRLGPVSVIFALTFKLRMNNANIKYPDEIVVVG